MSFPHKTSYNIHAVFCIVVSSRMILLNIQSDHVFSPLIVLPISDNYIQEPLLTRVDAAWCSHKPQTIYKVPTSISP